MGDFFQLRDTYYGVHYWVWILIILIIIIGAVLIIVYVPSTDSDSDDEDDEETTPLLPNVSIVEMKNKASRKRVADSDQPKSGALTKKPILESKYSTTNDFTIDELPFSSDRKHEPSTVMEPTTIEQPTSVEPIPSEQKIESTTTSSEQKATIEPVIEQKIEPTTTEQKATIEQKTATIITNESTLDEQKHVKYVDQDSPSWHVMDGVDDSPKSLPETAQDSPLLEPISLNENHMPVHLVLNPISEK